MNGNNFNGPGTGLNERLGINERPLDLLSYNNALRRECDKTAASIYSKPEPKPEPGPGDGKNWFYVENPENQSISVTIVNGKGGGAAFTSIEISDDKENWTELILDNNTYTFDIPATSKVYMRAEQSSWNYWSMNSTQFNVGGNIMSLLYGENFEDKTTLESNNTFTNLFADSTVVDASELILPATELADFCYNSMFEGCTSLTSAPQLPATELSDFCYASMFDDCTSLTSAPQLPATTLAEYCYDSMFSGCASLTNAPQLPATTLAKYCYSNMFAECTSLKSAPELPATKLAYSCYSYMFSNCTLLTKAPQLPATTLAEYCYGNMFNGCTSLKSVPQLPATTLSYFCYYNMFGDCTSLTTAPQLPATTLSDYCYSGMFAGCTSLTEAPQLPATTLAEACYSYMFNGCTSLNTVITHANDISANGCLIDWLKGVANSGTFYNLGTAEYTTGSSGIPEGWTVETELPQE